DVGLVVCQQQILVAVKKVVHEGTEQVPVAVGKCSCRDLINCLPEMGVSFVAVSRVITAGLEICSLCCVEPEEEEILLSDFLADFDVGTVQCADGKGAVDSKLHVAGTRSLFPGHGYLLGKVRRRIDQLAACYVEVREEHNLEPAGHVGICIYYFSHRIDQLDDQFRHVVTGRRLATENERPGSDVGQRVPLDPVVERYDVKHIEVLALVLMDTLHLHVEETRRVHLDPGPLPDGICQGLFVRLLYPLPFPLKTRISREKLQVSKLRLQITEPSGTQFRRDQLRLPGIAKGKPAAGGDAVGNVMEFLREQFVEVMQHCLFQKFGVQGSNTVDGMGTYTRQVGHAHVLVATLVDQRKARDARVVFRETDTRLVQKAPVYLVDDFHYTGQGGGEKRQGPLFQGFRQQRVVGVGKTLSGYSPGIVPFQLMFIHQQSHQLGDPHRRVGIVDLDGKGFVKRSDVFTP